MTKCTSSFVLIDPSVLKQQFIILFFILFSINLSGESLSHSTPNIDTVTQFYKSESLSRGPYYPGLFFYSFTSFNSTFPYGHNDYGLWQGRFFNQELSAKYKRKIGNTHIIINPTLYFSQNYNFSILEASPWSGSEYGYYESGIDYPQRYGDDIKIDFSLKNTVIRYLTDHFSASIGTENTIIGPGRQFSLLSGIDSDGYERVDIGIYDITLLTFTLEFFYWFGGLKGTQYNENTNDGYWSDTITGIYLGIQPQWFPGFSLGFTKVSQTSLSDFGMDSIFGAFDMSLLEKYTFGKDQSDGKVNIMLEWCSAKRSFRIYNEWFYEDYSTSLRTYTMIPEHTLGVAAGLEFKFPYADNLYFHAEWAKLDWSQDYEYNSLGWGGGFYRHHKTSLGYTNMGQILGSWTGPNSNAQYLRIEKKEENKSYGIFFERWRKDNTFIFTDPPTESPRLYVPVDITLGIDFMKDYNSASFKTELSCTYAINYNQQKENDAVNIHLEFIYMY